MDMSKMPASDYVGKANSSTGLTTMLKRALNDWPYVTHWELINGLPSSARIIYVRRQPGADAFTPSFRTPEEVSRDLIDVLLHTAKFAPPRNPEKNKCWEVRSCLVENEPAAILIADWTES